MVLAFVLGTVDLFKRASIKMHPLHTVNTLIGWKYFIA